LANQGQSDVAYAQIIQEIEAAGPGQDVYLTRLHHALASIVYKDGTLNELQEIGLRYRQLATMTNLTMAKAWASFAVGWAHYQRCEPTLAMEALLSVFDQPYRVHMGTMILALGALIPVAAELGRGEEACRLLERVSRIALERKSIAAADELSALAALAALLGQDRQRAMAWAEGFIQAGFQSAGGQLRNPDVSFQVPVFARIALASGSAGHIQLAVELLQSHVNLYQVLGNKAHVVNGAVLLACCLWRGSQLLQAVRTMQLAVDIGCPRGFRYPFFEQGREVAPMLYAMIQRGISADAASTLLAEYGRWSARSQGPWVSDNATAQDAIVPLSEREMEVLDLLAQRLTNKEIARRLDISPLTVRNHTSSIYSKLQVASRKQAVAQAQLLGLLSPATHP
jgi:LuxR family maltose regulon positive regulatory protein